MHLKYVRFAQEKDIGIITINRPEALNSLNKQVISQLKEVIEHVGQLRYVRAVILTGDGDKAFVAGADIKEMEQLSPADARDLAVNGHNLLHKIESLPQPIIAAINGFALGGGLEIALACDFMIASKTAKWGLPEVSLGLIPGYGGTQRLSRNLGRSLARRVALSAEMFTAQQGYEWGLFTQVTEPAELMPTAHKIAATMASRAPRALAWVKEAINHGFDKPLSDALRLEADIFGRAFETQDHAEGIKAFIEKRPPVFQGN